MGQEVGVSALQMVQGASVIANVGNRVTLSCVSRIVSADGKILWKNTPQISPNIISPGTAALLLSYMESTAQVGTGYRANIGDVPIGVKTGTAQMQDPATGAYSDTDFLSNCMAVFPSDDPQIILYIVINKAQGETYAGRIVAPVIADASNVIIDYLGLSRRNAPVVQHTGIVQIPKNQPVTMGDVVPDMTGIAKRLLTPLIARRDIRVLISGDGYVVSQSPAPGTPVTEGMTIELSLQ
jgi:cell division protein FtsI (penicillin-binding protein 3)